MGKNKLSSLLNNQPAKPEIRRGAGYKLSTEESAQTQESEITLSHNDTSVTPVTPERVARGYRFREDLIDAYKMLALKRKRKLYQVMEEALEEYLAKHAE